MTPKLHLKQEVKEVLLPWAKRLRAFSRGSMIGGLLLFALTIQLLRLGPEWGWSIVLPLIVCSLVFSFFAFFLGFHKAKRVGAENAFYLFESKFPVGSESREAALDMLQRVTRIYNGSSNYYELGQCASMLLQLLELAQEEIVEETVIRETSVVLNLEDQEEAHLFSLESEQPLIVQTSERDETFIPLEPLPEHGHET